MALGRQIADQLRLTSGDDIPAHWLAHHLAGLIDQADHAPADLKQAAQDRVIETILKLWTHRRALPEPVDPLSGMRLATEVLGRMSPKADPWARNKLRPNPPVLAFEPVLSDIFQTLSRTVTAGLLLTLNARLRPPSKVEVGLLNEDEERLLALAVDWMDYIRVDPPMPRVKIRYVSAKDAEGQTEAVADDEDVELEDLELEDADPEERDDEGAPSALEAFAQKEAQYQDAVLSNLKTARDQVDRLINRWERSVASAAEHRDDDGEDD